MEGSWNLLPKVKTIESADGSKGKKESVVRPWYSATEWMDGG